MKDVHQHNCVHVIPQNLTCDASMNAMTCNWMHMQQWHEEHLVPLTEKVHRLEGAMEIHLTPKLRELSEAHEGEDTV